MASIADFMVANLVYWRCVNVIFKYNTVAQEPGGGCTFHHFQKLLREVIAFLLSLYLMQFAPSPFGIFRKFVLSSPRLTIFLRLSNKDMPIIMYLLLSRAFKCTILVSGNLHLGMRKTFSSSILHLIPSNFRRYEIKLDVVLNVTLE